jgi:hypothetical protein
MVGVSVKVGVADGVGWGVDVGARVRAGTSAVCVAKMTAATVVACAASSCSPGPQATNIMMANVHVHITQSRARI